LEVELYSTENEEISSVAERGNRTMKERMHKYFTTNNTNKYIDVLDSFVEKDNNTRHSSIKMSHVEASKKENEVTVFRNLYPDYESCHNIGKREFLTNLTLQTGLMKFLNFKSSTNKSN